MRSIVIGLLLCTLLTGCPSEPTKTAAPKKTAAVSKSPAAETPAKKDVKGTYPVVCGCKLPVKKCSEWAEVDGKHLKLAGDLGLKGSMPFCGKTGLKAEIEGTVEGEELKVKSFKLKP